MCCFPSKPNEPVIPWIINVFLTLLEAPYPMQRMDVCIKNMSLPAYRRQRVNTTPLCSICINRESTESFLPRPSAESALQRPTIPPMASTHVLSTWIPCQPLTQGFSQSTQSILFTGGLVCPDPNFLGT